MRARLGALLLVTCLVAAGCVAQDPEDAEDPVTEAPVTATSETTATSDPNATETPEEDPKSPMARYPEHVTAVSRGNATLPSYRPDGSGIAWMDWPPGNASAGKVVTASTTGAVQRTFTGVKFIGPALAWNPSAGRLAVAVDDGETFVYILNTADRSMKKLHTTGGMIPFQWISEGIVAVSNVTGKSEIVILNEDGSVKRQVTNDTRWKWAPFARPDSAVASRNEMLVVLGEAWVPGAAPGTKDVVGKIARYDLATGQLKKTLREDVGDEARYGQPWWRNGDEVLFRRDDGMLFFATPDGYGLGEVGVVGGFSLPSSGNTLLYGPCGDGAAGICSLQYQAALS